MIAGVRAPPDPDDRPDLAALQGRIGHRFADESLLLTAITHRSWSHEAPGPEPDNESLEFLGDAVLGFLLADRLYDRFPGLDEGRLSKHKAMLERLSTLAEIAGELGLGGFLRLGRGERRGGGARNVKILSNAVEALVAAVYLDGGLEAARELVDRLIASRVADLDPHNPIVDYKSALQELAQGHGIGTPTYAVVAEDGPDHDKRFTVEAVLEGRSLGEGTGFTKRGAQQVAARQGLETLQAELEEQRAESAASGAGGEEE